MSVATSPVGSVHASNLLTYASLLASVAALAFAVNGSTAGAGAFLALSVVFDTFDGKFAGLFERTGTERAIGVQIDSLSDAIAFGIAPAICVASLGGPSRPGALWWIAVFAFAACTITRLAFYNVTHEQTKGFIGLPVPVAALILASALLASPGIGATTTLLFATAALMVLPLPVPRPSGLGLAVFVCWPLGVMAAHLMKLGIRN